MAGVRRKAVYGLLRVYKLSFSWIFYAAGARCQHKPSCSEYGAECVARHGWWAGGLDGPCPVHPVPARRQFRA